MSGWAKRWAEVVTQLEKRGVNGRLTMHDLRRTARSWWSELGVTEPVAELMLNHRPRSRLVALYDRSERMDERHAAAERWAEFVFSVVEGGEDAENARSAEDAKDAEDNRDASAHADSGRHAAIGAQGRRGAVLPKASAKLDKTPGQPDTMPAPASVTQDAAAAAYLRGVRART
jgi:hypothetical protein